MYRKRITNGQYVKEDGSPLQVDEPSTSSEQFEPSPDNEVAGSGGNVTNMESDNSSSDDSGITTETFEFLTSQILELFPTETCRPIYYLPYKESKKFGGKNAKGCLYNYYNDIREEFTEAGWITEKEKKTSNNNKSTHLCPESFFDHDDILCNTNSQTDRTDDLKIGKKWNECFDHRLKQLSIVYKDKDGATTLAITQQHYVDHYKCLKSPLSTALLIEDYEKIITLLINNNKEKEDALVISSDILNKNFFENKWPDIAKKIFQYCKASRIKDISTLKESNKNIFSGVPDQHKTSLALYLLPYCLTLSKKITVDGIETSVNKSDQCLSFILHIEKEEDLDAKLKEFQNKLDALKLDTHPIYVLCGPLKRLEKSFLVIHDTKFKYLNIKKGFDIYFKCMLALRAWPFICDHVWSFVQQYVYDLPNDSSLFLVNKIYLPVDTLNVRLKGIKEECVFNRVNNFHVIDNYSFDMMHDILEGVCSYTLHAVFNHYIFDEKVFSLKTLNERIKNFDCNGQQCNRPPPITTNRLKTQPTLKMSAAETLFVVRYIQLMIGDLIDKKDEHWTLLKLLRQIVDIVTSDRIVKETPLLLVDYVQDFNKLLLTDYGPCVHYSTMRFESRHRPIKSISFSSNCKKNLLHSITVKQKLRLLEVIHNTQLETTNLSDLDNDKNSFQSNLNDIVINGRKYQIGSFIAVDITKSEVTIGKIEQIVTVNAPVLAFPNLNEPYNITTDASGYAIGGVLSQGEVGKDRPIAYTSRALRGPELNYEVYEKEALAIIHSTEQFHSYIYNRKITIYTDHQPLIWFKTADLNTRVQKWRFKLSVYDYTVVYKKGKSNVNADSLSRNIPEESNNEALCVVTRSKDKEIAEKENLESTPTPPVPKRGRPPKHLQKPKPAPPPRNTDKRQTKQTEKYDPSPTPKPSEPDPRTFNIPQSESENSSESEQESSEEEGQSPPEITPIQPENIPTEPSQIENQSPPEQVSAENTTKSTIDIVYSKDLMHCVTGNIVYLIDTNGKPIDAGATKLHEFHKLPTFTDLSVGDVLIHNTKQEKNHFALCLKDESPLAPSSCKANLEALFSTLKELLKKKKVEKLFVTKTEHLFGLQWNDIIDLMTNILEGHQLKLIICTGNLTYAASSYMQQTPSYSGLPEWPGAQL
ncbi:hypothetical protein TKK_0008338 [Trichogramma kaykai]